jgi:uncharacterized protein (TIGR00255 family)
MRSMTGFGAATSEERSLALRAEARSVNHRFLQIKVRLPGELAHLEPEIDELVRKRLERGSVSITVALSGAGTLGEVTVNTESARRYKRLLTRLARELEIPPEISLDALVALPGVVGAGADGRSLQRGRRATLSAVAGALEALERMREAEGRHLRSDLERNASAIEKVVARIAKRMPQAVLAHQKKLHERVEELIAGHGAVQPEDLAREVALIADRMDVSEELSRLDSHIAQLRALLERSGPVGRQLDFLVQEMLREANTIGSKCNDAQVAHGVIEVKTSIERLREQVQNVE